MGHGRRFRGECAPTPQRPLDCSDAPNVRVHTASARYAPAKRGKSSGLDGVACRRRFFMTSGQGACTRHDRALGAAADARANGANHSDKRERERREATSMSVCRSTGPVLWTVPACLVFSGSRVDRTKRKKGRARNKKMQTTQAWMWCAWSQTACPIYCGFGKAHAAGAFMHGQRPRLADGRRLSGRPPWIVPEAIPEKGAPDTNRLDRAKSPPPPPKETGGWRVARHMGT